MVDIRGSSFWELLRQQLRCEDGKPSVLIDALNDSPDIMIPAQTLRSFLEVVARYEWIGVAISVRSTYQDLIIPSDEGEDRLMRIEHHGFAGVEFQATRRFFDYYGVEQPSVPLLSPEFQTPLFLKVLCEGLRNSGRTRLPRGLHGITAIFGLFVSSIQRNCRRPTSST